MKDDTLIKVYMVFTAKEYNIIYWDLRGHENSFNPRKYTIFDSFDIKTAKTEALTTRLRCFFEKNQKN